MKIEKCPITGSSEKIRYFDLGQVPLVNNLCDTKEESLNCEKYPLSVQFFPESQLTTLSDIVDKEKLFTNYLYRSGINKPYLTHCAKMYDYLSSIISFSQNDIVVDIGGNDGSLLKEFRRENRNLHYINIDCSKSFIVDNAKEDIEYVNEFFCKDTNLSYKARVIVSTNVFQHTEDIRSFVQGVERNLSNSGIWCLEFPYILTTLMQDNYDQIYHEHIYYYSLRNIVDLLEQEGLRVINASYHDMHAGTLRVLSVKRFSRMQADSSVASFLNLEKFYTKEYCETWGKRAQEKIRLFKENIYNLVDAGTSIIGFGAAAKGCVFLNSCDITREHVSYVIDDTPYKQDKYIPGTGIKIVSREILKDTKPDFILILAHNFKDYIIDSLKGQYKGSFIVMFPEVKII